MHRVEKMSYKELKQLSKLGRTASSFGAEEIHGGVISKNYDELKKDVRFLDYF